MLKAGTWKSMSTFASFYLRDVTHRYLDTFSLGLIVSALRVIHYVLLHSSWAPLVSNKIYSCITKLLVLFSIFGAFKFLEIVPPPSCNTLPPILGSLAYVITYG